MQVHVRRRVCTLVHATSRASSTLTGADPFEGLSAALAIHQELALEDRQRRRPC